MNVPYRLQMNQMLDYIFRLVSFFMGSLIQCLKNIARN